MSEKQRIDIFYHTHKALRSALSQLQMHGGRLDFADIEKFNEFVLELHSLWKLLHLHAEGEDAFVMPLLEIANAGVYNGLKEEHNGILLSMDAIQKEIDLIKDLSPAERVEKNVPFLQTLNDFVADFMIHLQKEELKAMPELWKELSDNEIVEIHMKFLRITSSDLMAYYAKHLFLAINPYEQVNFLKMVRDNAPDDVYAIFVDIAEGILKKPKL